MPGGGKAPDDKNNDNTNNSNSARPLFRNYTSSFFWGQGICPDRIMFWHIEFSCASIVKHPVVKCPYLATEYLILFLFCPALVPRERDAALLCTPNLPTKICWLKPPGEFPMDMRIPPLKHKNMFQSNPLKFRILVGRLAVSRMRGHATEAAPCETDDGWVMTCLTRCINVCMYVCVCVYIYIYIYLYICVMRQLDTTSTSLRETPPRRRGGEIPWTTCCDLLRNVSLQWW